MIREYLNRRKNLRTVFSEVTEPKTVEKLMAMESLVAELRQGSLECIVVAVAGDSAALISKRIATVCELVAKHNGTIDHIVSSLVVVIYGSKPLTSPEGHKRLDLVTDLIRTMGDQVKIIHGAGSGHFGLLGNATRFSYSFVLPGFLEAVASLSDLKFGETKEIKWESS